MKPKYKIGERRVLVVENLSEYADRGLSGCWRISDDYCPGSIFLKADRSVEFNRGDLIVCECIHLFSVFDSKNKSYLCGCSGWKMVSMED